MGHRLRRLSRKSATETVGQRRAVSRATMPKQRSSFVSGGSADAADGCPSRTFLLRQTFSSAIDSDFTSYLRRAKYRLRDVVSIDT